MRRFSSRSWAAGFLKNLQLFARREKAPIDSYNLIYRTELLLELSIKKKKLFHFWSPACSRWWKWCSTWTFLFRGHKQKKIPALNWSPAAPISLRNRFIDFLKLPNWSFHESSKKVFVPSNPTDYARMAFLEGLDAGPHPRTHLLGFGGQSLKGHAGRGLVRASLLKTGTLWGIFFAQMSRLIQRWTGPIWRSTVTVLLVLCPVHRNILKCLYLNANINPQMMV